MFAFQRAGRAYQNKQPKNFFRTGLRTWTISTYMAEQGIKATGVTFHQLQLKRQKKSSQF